MRTGRRRSVIALALGLAALAGVPGGGALAQKKGGGGTPIPPAPGTIYFSNGNGGSPFSSMNGDGSGRVASTGGVPTYQKHGNSRWFLQNRTVDDTGPDQWFAVNEAGAAVQLTNDPDLRRNGYPASWTKNDSAFSLCCVSETATEWVGRLVVVPVAWVEGVPTAGPATTVFELRRSLFDEWGNYTYEGYDEVNFGRHDWSTAGDEVALTRWVWGVGWVVDVVRFTAAGIDSRQLATRAANPVWSPDDGRIAALTPNADMKRNAGG